MKKTILNESLERNILLMKYDTKKTLSENKQLLNEEPFTIALLWIGGTMAVTALGTYIAKAVDENPDAAQSLRDFVTLGEKAYQSGGKISSGYDPGGDAIALYTAMFNNDWLGIGLSATEDEDTIIRIITSLTSVVDLAALNQKYKNAYRGRDMVNDLEDSLQSDEWAPISLWIEKVQDALSVVKDEVEKKDDGKKDDGKKDDGKKEEKKKEEGNDDGKVIVPPKRKWVDAPSCDEVSKGNGKIEFGMRGTCVETIQTKLNEKNQAGLTIDGKFGKLTKGGVTDFQTKNNISPANGIVDQKTLTLLLSSGSTDDLSTTDTNKFN
jgi:hypothetical protein